MGEMTVSGYYAALDGILAAVRRQTLVVAAALQNCDEEGTLVGTARLLWVLANAQQFAARSVAGVTFTYPRLTAVLDNARAWLRTESSITLTPTRAQRVLDLLLDSSLQLDPIDASNTLLINLDLDDLPLAHLAIRNARLIDVRCERAQLDAMDASGASLLRCHLGAASLRVAGLEHAVLEDCDLSRCNLERSRWSNAKVSRCTVTKAMLLDARFDDVTFTDCNFRDADFRAGLLMNARSASNARFVRCDLRGTNWTGRCLGYASFFDCKLHGAHGAADLETAAIERPDLSPQGDGSQVGNKGDVAVRWSGQAS